jgi:hypothetical protein
MDQVVCCQHVSFLTGARSPFSKMIVFGYYDGATSGVVLCGGCSAAYTFEMLALDGDGKYDRQAWDRGEEMRIFSLAALPSQSFARLVDTLTRIEAPKWPVWVPSRASSQEQLLQVVDKEVNAIVSAASHPGLVVASSALLKKIAVAHEVTTEQINTVQDWFSFLGLVRQADPE